MQRLDQLAIEPEKLVGHLECFDDDLTRVVKLIIDSKFEAADDICMSIESRAIVLGMDRIVQMTAEFRQVLSKRETWVALNHYTNIFRCSFLDVVIPLRFSIAKKVPYSELA